MNTDPSIPSDPSTSSEQTIFIEAIDLDDAEERRRYLDEACGDDKALRRNVEALLDASDDDDNPLDNPPVAFTDALDQASSHEQWIGTQIGDFRLMEQIGEGGFGLVFVAQQDQPVRRRVALKIVKPGMGTKEVIARFEAERQAVAMMDHPNIAAVFDAGVSDDGSPFFAMELVRGVTITEFADAHRLTIQGRLEIFSDVCKAVHHAHQKAVIHRDIKPSNVLVTLHDDRPVVKVIDFGVAKAIGQSLTDKTIYTRFFSMLGTPMYMSPEQAEMNGLDVDIRSDIYSLGVLLYELLSGTTPIDRNRLDSAGLDELRRIIREEEPPSPSRRLSTLGPQITTVSASRQAEPSRLTSTLRGDLDWIVMKSLEKDRNRRYDSAMALAADLRRYMQHEPIEARPPSTWYRLTRFASRYRVALGTAALVLLSLLGGLVASLWQMQRVADERDQKEAALKEIELFSKRVTRANELVASAESLAQASQIEAAREVFDKAVTQQTSYYLPYVSRGQFFARQFQLDESADDFAIALTLGSPTGTPQWSGAAALLSLSNRQEALAKFRDHYRNRLAEVDENESLETVRWEWIRSGVQVDGFLDVSEYEKLVTLAELKLIEPQRGPGRRFPSLPFRTSLDEAGQERQPRDADLRGGFGGPPDRGEGPLNEASSLLPLPVQLHVTGLAHLRAGHFDRAIGYFHDAVLQPRWPNTFMLHSPLAIAYHATGDFESGKDELSRADQIAAQLDDLSEFTADFPSTPWFDVIELKVLHSEATRRFSVQK